MVLLRCALLGHVMVIPVCIALTPDSTAHELQRAVKKSAPLLVTCGANELRLFLAKKWLPRDVATLSDGTRLSAVMGDERWLQLDDPELLALMTPHVDPSARCMTMDTDVSAAIADVRREFLVPDLELLPQSKLLDSFCDDDEDETSTAVHVLLALPDEPLLRATCRRRNNYASIPEAAPPHEAQERRIGSQNVDTPPFLHAIRSMNIVDNKETPDGDSSAEAGCEDDSLDKGELVAPTDDPQVLLALQKQHDAIPRVHYDLRPAQVNPAVIEALHAKIARFSTEYTIMGRERQQFLCIGFVLSTVCSLFRNNKPQLFSHVAIPGISLHVRAKFDFKLQRSHRHLGVVLAKQKPSLPQRLEDQQHPRAMLQQALRQNWLGAEVLADSDPNESAPEVFGIVTDCVNWVFLRYSDFKIHAHEATLQFGRGGVPMKTSLAEIVGLAYEMLR